MNTVTLLIQTNQFKGKSILAGELPQMIWASDDLRTVSHYYEGCVLEIKVKLLKSLQKKYVRTCDEAAKYKSGYTWGTAEMRCPLGAHWYSFQREYLQKYLINIKEVHPNLQKYQDDD